MKANVELFFLFILACLYICVFLYGSGIEWNAMRYSNFCQCMLNAICAGIAI